MTEKDFEFQLYGRQLAGDETELDKAKLARTRYLKLKMRKPLAVAIGDDPDTITDVLRAVLLCHAVAAGLIADAALIARLNAYIQDMIGGYGGAEAIMDTLEYDREQIATHVMHGYFAAKVMIDAAETVEDVMAVDLAEA